MFQKNHPPKANFFFLNLRRPGCQTLIFILAAFCVGDN
jgi:hypothetical protein